MKSKILTVVIIILFINLFLSLLMRSDSVIGFIPLLGTVSMRQVSVDAYDFMLFLAILLLRVLYGYFGITLSDIKALPFIFYPARITEIVLSVTSAVFAHFRLWPLVYQIFESPVGMLRKAPEPIRRAFLMILPFLMILAVMVINRHKTARYSPPQAAPRNTPLMNSPLIPPPPRW